MAKKEYRSAHQHSDIVLPNSWDFIVFAIIFGIFAALGWGFSQMATPFDLGEPLSIELSPWALPGYAVRTVSRMLIGLSFALLFTFTVGTLAAKNKRAEKVIIPFIDIMQSAPILGFLTVAVLLFIPLFPGSLLGPECAAIFAIFTSQVWNMTLGFYQSLRLLPKEMREVASMFGLGPWQKFWRVEVPYATPSLLWNMMISMSAGWFFVVASEAITVSNQQIHLPGIGSYIHIAVLESNNTAILWAILAMFFVILLYDQLLFRPLVAWTSRFSAEIKDDDDYQEAWFLNWLQRTRFMKLQVHLLESLKDWFVNGIGQYRLELPFHSPRLKQVFALSLNLFWWVGILGGSLVGLAVLMSFLYEQFTVSEVLKVFALGGITGTKVIISVILSSIIWVPVGVWMSTRPKIAVMGQTIAQFLASFPANIVYPVVFGVIVAYDMNVDIWTIPLMMLGTQWYILFNVIAGMSCVPSELKLAVKNFGLRGPLLWKRFILPSIFPYYVTGAMACAGGCWNASIVAEVIELGNQTIRATGLGSYHQSFAVSGDFARIILSVAVMCLYVMVLNRLLWDRLYALAEDQYSFDEVR